MRQIKRFDQFNEGLFGLFKNKYPDNDIILNLSKILDKATDDEIIVTKTDKIIDHTGKKSASRGAYRVYIEKEDIEFVIEYYHSLNSLSTGMASRIGTYETAIEIDGNRLLTEMGDIKKRSASSLYFKISDIFSRKQENSNIDAKLAKNTLKKTLHYRARK